MSEVPVPCDGYGVLCIEIGEATKAFDKTKAMIESLKKAIMSSMSWTQP